MGKIISVILAGGQSRRMRALSSAASVDKAELKLGGERLIDLAIMRISPQCDEVLISAKHGYGTGLPVITDDVMGPKGPAAGIFAARKWAAANSPASAGFFTMPVDTPFFPTDLIQRLGQTNTASIAADDNGLHPTFGHWLLEPLASYWSTHPPAEPVSLRELAGQCGAKQVRWSGESDFFNINSPEDLKKAEMER
ncbi:MAG: NTP transferase domain-containing protein [Sphingorhabdus sp.]